MSNINETLSFGNTLKYIRAKRNLPIRKFSEITGISPAYICDLEKGHRKGTFEILTNISEKLILSEHEQKILINAFYRDRMSLPKNLINYLIDNDLLETLNILTEYDKDGANIKSLALKLKNNKQL